MLFNGTNGGDPRSFMYYNGKYYINGTIIELSDQFINNHYRLTGEKIWKYARFYNQVIKNGRLAYSFDAAKFDYLSLRQIGLNMSIKKEYTPYVVIEALELGFAIKEIIHPIVLSDREQEIIDASIKNLSYSQASPRDSTELRLGWISYILVMIFSLIFEQFYLIWILASVIFFKWKKGVL